jgi:hypothetical protein
MAQDSALQSTIKTQRSMGMKGDNWDNYAVARDVLHSELGLNGEPAQHEYYLDQATRDTLWMAHSLATDAVMNS